MAHYQIAGAYEQKGDRERAREFYRQFLEIWQQADPDLPVFLNAKKRLADLDAGSR
jgi:DNA-binding SARP family transcriptional activator